MNSRQRKKWLKKHNKWVPYKDVWDLYYTTAEFILPRLKLFRKVTQSYPGTMTFDEWLAIIDKMILAFEYILEADDWWMDDERYDYIRFTHFHTEPTENGLRKLIIEKEDAAGPIEEAHNQEEARRNEIIKEGLQLFAEYFRDLWY